MNLFRLKTKPEVIHVFKSNFMNRDAFLRRGFYIIL